MELNDKVTRSKSNEKVAGSLLQRHAEHAAGLCSRCMLTPGDAALQRGSRAFHYIAHTTGLTKKCIEQASKSAVLHFMQWSARHPSQASHAFMKWAQRRVTRTGLYSTHNVFGSLVGAKGSINMETNKFRLDKGPAL